MCHFRVGINLIGFRLERRSIESLRAPRRYLHWWKKEKNELRLKRLLHPIWNYISAASSGTMTVPGF